MTFDHWWAGHKTDDPQAAARMAWLASAAVEREWCARLAEKKGKVWAGRRDGGFMGPATFWQEDEPSDHTDIRKTIAEAIRKGHGAT
jgi:hypothetical protein